MDIAQVVERFETWETRADFPFVVLARDKLAREDDPFGHDMPRRTRPDAWPEGAAAAALAEHPTAFAAATTDAELRALLLAATRRDETAVWKFPVRCTWMDRRGFAVRPALGLPWRYTYFYPATARRVLEVSPARARLILDLDAAYRDATVTDGLVQDYVDRIQADEWTTRDPDWLTPPTLHVRYTGYPREPIPGEFGLRRTGAEMMQAIINADETVDVEMLFIGRQSAFDAIAWLPEAAVDGAVLD